MITLNQVTKVYQNDPLIVQALYPINLRIERGEFLAIMGPSGSGKSTLMNILGCLDIPSKGTYELDGEQVQALNEDQLAKTRNQKIGFVFQNFNLLPRQTVLRNVELPMLYGGIDKNMRKDRARELLKKVDLSDRWNHRPNELSGGQRQRVAIARALAMNPAILLADEPTGNLDVKTSAEIMALFQQLNEEGVTIIVVTHELNIANYANRILCFGDGIILEDYLNNK